LFVENIYATADMAIFSETIATNMIKRALLIICVIAGLFECKNLKAQNWKTITACRDDSIQTWLTRYHVPAVAIGIIENNKIKSINYYGGIRAGVPASEKTIWNVASLTKPVTAMTIMSLVNKGEFGLDEPVSQYFIDPDIKDEPRTGKLTARIILSHQTGFKNWPWMEADHKLKFHFQPGTGFGYSGAGYEYLRMTVEKKFNKSLEELANEALLTPAGMKNTHFGWNDGLDSTRFAGAYDENGVLYPSKLRSNNAADWLVTSMEDYCRFAIYVMNGAGVSNKLFNEITRIQVHFDTLAMHKDEGMGLGWEVIRNLSHEEYALTHNGSDAGIATIVLLLPNSKRGIVIFTNGDKGQQVFVNILKGSKIDLQPELAKSMNEFK
jgi:CubicO group peptidase (beta-lactamase class C family)